MAFVFNKAEFDTKSCREAAEVFPRLMSVDGSVAVVLMESHCFVLALLYYQLLFCNVVNTALACQLSRLATLARIGGCEGRPGPLKWNRPVWPFLC